MHFRVPSFSKTTSGRHVPALNRLQSFPPKCQIHPNRSCCVSAFCMEMDSTPSGGQSIFGDTQRWCQGTLAPYLYIRDRGLGAVRTWKFHQPSNLRDIQSPSLSRCPLCPVWKWVSQAACLSFNYMSAGVRAEHGAVYEAPPPRQLPGSIFTYIKVPENAPGGLYKALSHR